MLWHRTVEAPDACRWTLRTAPTRRHPRRPAALHPPVVREPETGWWETQAALDDPAALTVAAVREPDADADSAAVASRLAALATDEELLVVIGTGPRTGPGHRTIADLRDRLPRHDVVALPAPTCDAGAGRQTAARLLEEGSLPVVVTAMAGLHDVTAELASFLRADRVVRVFPTGDGAELYQVWRRSPELMIAS